MRETGQDLEALQALMDDSIASASGHLRDIISGDRLLNADDVVTLLVGMKVISVATVTASGQPRISGLDGHFLHGTWTFGSSASAIKARHLAVRPAVSVAHIDGEEFAVYAHGAAERLLPTDPDWHEIIDHWTQHYGQSPLSFEADVVMWRLRPHWLVGYAADKDELFSRGSGGAG